MFNGINRSVIFVYNVSLIIETIVDSVKRCGIIITNTSGLNVLKLAETKAGTTYLIASVVQRFKAAFSRESCSAAAVGFVIV